MIAGRLNEPIKIFHPTIIYNEFGEATFEYYGSGFNINEPSVIENN